MKYEKGKEITDINQFKKGRKYYVGTQLFKFLEIGNNGNPMFAGLYSCVVFDFESLDFYEAVEVSTTLDDKITELVELGRSKGLKINITIE